MTQQKYSCLERLRGVCILVILTLPTQSLASKPAITACIFTPDGNAVVTASQLGVQLFSWPTLKQVRLVKVQASNLHCLSFSPDGKYLAVGGGNPSEEGIIEIFDWQKVKSVSVYKGHADSVHSIAWQGNSKILSASLDREINVWNISEEKNPTQILRGHSKGVSSLVTLNNNKTLVSAGQDASVRVWDLSSGKLSRNLSQHSKGIHQLALRPKIEGLSMIASAAGDRTIRFWQPTIGRMVRYVRLPVEPLSIAWLNKGEHLVAACIDGQIRVINAAEVKVIQTIPAIKGWPYAIAVHPTDGRVIVGGTNGQLKVLTVKH